MGYPNVAVKVKSGSMAGLGGNAIDLRCLANAYFRRDSTKFSRFSAIRKCLMAGICFLPQMLMGQEKSKPCLAGTDTITAKRIAHEIELDARHPAPEWGTADGISFCEDWQGRNADADRQTSVQVLYTPKTLYLRFECRYRELSVFEDSDANGRRHQLWD